MKNSSVAEPKTIYASDLAGSLSDFLRELDLLYQRCTRDELNKDEFTAASLGEFRVYLTRLLNTQK